MNAFEISYLSYFKNSIDDAKNGLKNYLMIKNEEKLTFHINSDDK